MHLIRNQKYRDHIRTQHLTLIKNNIRNQLTSLGNTLLAPSAQLSKQFAALFPDVIDQQSLKILQTQAFTMQQEQKIALLIEKFQLLIKSRQMLTKDQCIDVQIFGGLLWNFRLLIIYGKQKVEMHKVGNIYAYLKSRITEGISYLNGQFEDTAKESISQRLNEYQHLLTLTFITLLSQYLNQGGSLLAPHHQNWLIHQYNRWANEVSKLVQKALELIEQSLYDDSQTFLISKRLQSLGYYLIEQQKVVEIMIYYKPQHFQSLLLELLSDKKVKTIIQLMRSYQFPDQLQLICGNTISLVSQLQSHLFFKCLIQNDYISYVKLQLIIRQQYKSFTKKTKLNNQQKCGVNIISNLLTTLSNLSVYYADVLWRQGLCQDLKCMSEEIRHPEIRQDFITIVLQCIMCSSSPEMIQNQQDLMSWMLKLIESKIQDQISQDFDDLIDSCLQVIRYFFQLGNQQMQQKKLQCNPYHLQFKYLYGYDIFSKSKQCREFLDQLLPDERDNYM